MAFAPVVVDDLVHKLADAVEFDLYRVSGFQENRRLALEANTCRRSHRDDVARLEDERPMTTASSPIPIALFRDLGVPQIAFYCSGPAALDASRAATEVCRKRGLL